jgi:RNA-directed DNA polymerase
LIQLINPILRGWVNYFAVGNSSECFGFIRDWVEKKVRRQMMRARQRKGFGWTRWSRQWLYNTLKLFNGYKVKWLQPKVAPAGPITLEVKQAGERISGKSVRCVRRGAVTLAGERAS